MFNELRESSRTRGGGGVGGGCWGELEVLDRWEIWEPAFERDRDDEADDLGAETRAQSYGFGWTKWVVYLVGVVVVEVSGSDW